MYEIVIDHDPNQADNAAEQEAIKNGCVLSTIDTIDFQAEAFYVKCGYERIGEIKNYWYDHSFLRKRLKG